MKFMLKLYTGPGSVGQIAEKCREAGVHVFVEGTEHLHLEGEGLDALEAFNGIVAKLKATHQRSFGLTMPYKSWQIVPLGEGRSA